MIARSSRSPATIGVGALVWFVTGLAFLMISFYLIAPGLLERKLDEIGDLAAWTPIEDVVHLEEPEGGSFGTGGHSRSMVSAEGSDAPIACQASDSGRGRWR